MTSVEEARQIILDHKLPQHTETVPLGESLHKVLAQNILADRDAPPFHRVTMDGIAIRASKLQEKKRFPIENIQAAGHPQLSLKDENHCLEVMTGAVLPENTDCVIPYEQLQIENGTAFVMDGSFTAHQNVHMQGTDARQGDVLFRSGLHINPGAIGVMATVGVENVSVIKAPKIIICSTGDELVDIHEKPLPHQIRKSNVYMLQTALKEFGIEANTIHLADDLDILERELKKLLDENDILLFSGAVSKGKYDYLPEVLEKLGVNKKIHGIKQKPGKPFLFGQMDNRLVFGFPGNPASTMICFHLYFKPWLMTHLGLEGGKMTAVLSEDVMFHRPVTYHLLVKVDTVGATLTATPVKNSGSGDLIHLAEADGVLSLPADQERFLKAHRFPLTYLTNKWLL
jgi:molybdopterin molybdotransferase